MHKGGRIGYSFIAIFGRCYWGLPSIFFTRHIENQRHIRELRAKAYMDYLKTVSELANYRPPKNTKEGLDLMVKTADAKSRICLYGSNEAIHAFSNFEKLGATLNTTNECQAFTDMVGVMRVDSGGSQGVEGHALQNVLFGPRQN